MTARTRIVIGLGSGLAILAVVGWLSYRSTAELIETNRRVRHTYRVREHLATLSAVLRDAEGGVRGYVITGDDAHLAAYRVAPKRADLTLRRLRAIVTDREQQRRLDGVEQLVAARLAVLADVVDARRAQGFEAAAQLIRAGPGKRLMDAIRTSLGELKSAQTASLRLEEDAAHASTRNTVRTLSVSALLGFAMLLLVFYRLDREIVQRYGAQQALAQSEARYRAVSELTSDYAYAFRIEPNGAVAVEWIAGAFTPITGYTPGEVEERGGGFSLVHPDDVAIALRRLQTLVSGQPDVSEFRIITKGGDVRWLRENARPAVDAAGRCVRVFAAAQDVTERKQAEDRARQHQAELAHVLRVGTIGEMAAGLAHEINQPLSAIVSYAKGCARRLQAGSAPSNELLGAVEEIAAQAVRADQIVRRLRGFVRKRNPRRERVDMNDLVQEVARLVANETQKRRITMRLNLSPRMPPVEVDSIQIEQVILNLVRNGLEAMSTAPSDGSLSIQTLMVGADMIEVAVCDAGEGFDAAPPGRVFEPFFSTKPDGLGMGLSISRSIIEAHGGRIWATPNPDRGMTFRFTIPITDGVGADAI